MKEYHESASSWGWNNKEYDEYKNQLPRAKIDFDGKTYDITDYLLSDPGKNKQNELLIYSLDDHHDLCIRSYSYNWNEEKKLFKDYSVSGYLLWK